MSFISLNKQGPQRIQYIIEEIKRTLALFLCRVSHIYRKRHEIADFFSNVGFEMPQLKVLKRLKDYCPGQDGMTR